MKTNDRHNRTTSTLLTALVAMAVGLFGVALPGYTQATPATVRSGAFNVSARVVAVTGGGSSDAATDVGGSVSLTPNLSIRNDNILIPALNTQFYLGGIQYALPLSKMVKYSKLKVDPKKFQLYITGSTGVVRQSIGASTQHIAVSAGGGINYDPLGTGKFSLSLVSVQWLHGSVQSIPSAATNNRVMVSTGVALDF